MRSGRRLLEPGTYGQGEPKKDPKTGRHVVRAMAVHPSEQENG